MIHSHTELRFIGPHVGFGFVATRRIPEVTVSWVRDESHCLLPPSAPLPLGSIFADTQKDCYLDGAGIPSIAGTLHGICMRCAPPARRGFNFEATVRNIEADEELCDDYGRLNLGARALRPE